MRTRVKTMGLGGTRSWHFSAPGDAKTNPARRTWELTWGGRLRGPGNKKREEEEEAVEEVGTQTSARQRALAE